MSKALVRKLRLGTIKEAAAENHLCERTIRSRIADGTVAAYRVNGGRSVRVDLDQARAALLKPMNPAAERVLSEVDAARDAQSKSMNDVRKALRPVTSFAAVGGDPA